MEGEDTAEKTLVHKTAVKQISTHRDQENSEEICPSEDPFSNLEPPKESKYRHATSFW